MKSCHGQIPASRLFTKTIERTNPDLELQGGPSCGPVLLDGLQGGDLLRAACPN